MEPVTQNDFYAGIWLILSTLYFIKGWNGWGSIFGILALIRFISALIN